MSEKPPSQKSPEAESKEPIRIDMEKGESFEAFADRFIKASTRGEVTGKAYNIEMKLPHLKTSTSVDSTHHLYSYALAILNKQLITGYDAGTSGLPKESKSNEPREIKADGGVSIYDFAYFLAADSLEGPVYATFNNVKLTVPGLSRDSKQDIDSYVRQMTHEVIKQYEDGLKK